MCVCAGELCGGWEFASAVAPGLLVYSNSHIILAYMCISSLSSSTSRVEESKISSSSCFDFSHLSCDLSNLVAIAATPPNRCSQFHAPQTLPKPRARSVRCLSLSSYAWRYSIQHEERPTPRAIMQRQQQQRHLPAQAACHADPQNRVSHSEPVMHPCSLLRKTKQQIETSLSST